MPAVNYRPTGARPSRGHTKANSALRIRILYSGLMLICLVFVIRLFYLQVIKHDYYSKQALNYQLKEYQIPAERGVIRAHNGSDITPLVLNEVKYTLFADPVYVEDVEKAALELNKITGLDASELKQLLETEDTRYVILAKKLSKEQHEQVTALEMLGIGTREQVYRTYPHGALASQLLGFVNDEGEGQYGLEQFMNDRLAGQAGELKAITDSSGVPLVSNPDNVVTEAKPGESVTLSVDIGMQSRLEELVKKRAKVAKSPGVSAVIMDPNTGSIKAMANYPTYDPTKLSEVKDISVLTNSAVNRPIEIGSIMKTFTVAAGLEEGVIEPKTAFYDAGFVKVGDHTITDVHDSRGTQTVESTMIESLNTGAIWVLEQIGRGSLNDRARLTWHKYMTEKFFYGHLSGVEQASESPGFVPAPEDNGQGINVTYATTTFGQGMTANLVQVASAFSALVNGGTYYQPRLVEMVHKDGKNQYLEPVVRKGDVVSPETSRKIRSLLETVRANNLWSAGRDGYSVGSKSGTAEFIDPETGKYRTDRYNGTYTGFVGGDKPEYVVAVLVLQPGIPGNAGYTSAGPLFSDISNMLIDNFGVTPKGQ